jgi:hypothetical protein
VNKDDDDEDDDDTPVRLTSWSQLVPRSVAHLLSRPVTALSSLRATPSSSPVTLRFGHWYPIVVAASTAYAPTYDEIIAGRCGLLNRETLRNRKQSLVSDYHS